MDDGDIYHVCTDLVDDKDGLIMEMAVIVSPS